MVAISRYDKVASAPVRVPLLAAKAANTDAVGGANPPLAYGIDSAGKGVPGAGQSGIAGILVLTKAKRAGDIVDLITDGEITEFGGVAGTKYTANTTTGVISSAAASGTQIPVGYTVEADRLIVRLGIA